MDSSDNISRNAAHDLGVASKPIVPGSIREVLKIALPMVIANSAYTVMQFSDRIFLARYSDIAIQAAMPAGLLSFSLICLFLATAGYSGTFVAQFFGAKELDNCVKSTVHGLYFILICSPIFLAMIPFGGWIFELFRHPPDLIEQERIYLKWMLFCALPSGLGWSLTGFFTGRGKVRLTTTASVLGCIVNIALDYAMIFGKWGFPEMGLRGAAIVTFISSWVAPGILFAFMLKSKLFRNLGLRRALAFDFTFMKRLLRFGLPAGIQVWLDVGAFSVFVLMTARLEPATLMVANIVFSVNNLAFSPLMGFGAAASILSGQYHGAGDNAHAMKSGWSSLKLGCIYMAIIGAVFVLLPETLLSLFPSEGSTAAASPDFLRTGRHLLYVMTLWGFLDTANIIFMGSLKGVGDTKFVMYYISSLAWFLWLPGEVLIFRYGGGILAAWLWMGFYIAVAAFGFAIRWHRGKWQRIDMVHGAS